VCLAFQERFAAAVGNSTGSTGAKLCGGYHPDWMIRWIARDGTEHELHLCFGCHEAKLYGPDYQLYCELGEDGYKSLKAILDRYSSQGGR
jgi:hypothetical protein